MVFVPEEKLKKKMELDGSVLKYMYSVSGAGKGLVAIGAMCIPIGLLLAAALFNVLGANSAITIAAVIILPSILLIILGNFLQKRKVNGYMGACEQQSGLTQTQLRQVEEEFKQPGTLLFSLDKGKDSNSLKKMGFITSNYIKFPGVGFCLFPLQNLVACFYTKKYLCQDGGYDRALIAYGSDSDRVWYFNSPPEKASLEIVEAVEAHNPLVITEHHFAYEGKEYDAVRRPEEVVALHLRMRTGQGGV